MLISYKHQFLFIHVPKAAGISVQRALESYAEPQTDSWWRRRLPVLGEINRVAGLYRRTEFGEHITARQVRRCLPRDVYHRLFKFAFVRNPWDMQVSRYAYVLQNKSHHRHYSFHSLGTFEAFLEWEIRTGRRLQHRQLTDRHGRALVDFVGHFETVEADFAHVCRRLAIRAVLPHTNVSAHRDYRSYYTERTRNLVAHHHRRDIELFGYTFDGLLPERLEPLTR